MKLDEIWYINLEQAVERHYAQLGHFETREVPRELVKRFIASDFMDFESYEHLCSQIRNSKFGFLASKNQNQKQELALFKLQHYNFCRALYSITKSDKNVLLIHDDCFFTIDFSKIQQILDTIDFNIDILWFHTYFLDPRTGFLEDDKKALKLGRPTQTPLVYQNFCGFSEKARLFTPKGASLFLSLIESCYNEALIWQNLANFRDGSSDSSLYTAEYVPWLIANGFTEFPKETCEQFYYLNPNIIKERTLYKIGPHSFVFHDDKEGIVDIKKYESEIEKKRSKVFVPQWKPGNFV